jgi:hypothetical protein
VDWFPESRQLQQNLYNGADMPGVIDSGAFSSLLHIGAMRQKKQVSLAADSIMQIRTGESRLKKSLKQQQQSTKEGIPIPGNPGRGVSNEQIELLDERAVPCCFPGQLPAGQPS